MGWQLLGGGHTDVYDLFHKEHVDLTNGFVICNMNKGEYYQVFYYVYENNPPKLDGCADISLEVSIFDEGVCTRLMLVDTICSLYER